MVDIPSEFINIYNFFHEVVDFFVALWNGVDYLHSLLPSDFATWLDTMVAFLFAGLLFALIARITHTIIAGG